jgi:hypothetical protein
MRRELLHQLGGMRARLILTWLGDDAAGPWLQRNRELLLRLIAGDAALFDQALRRYMVDADAEVVARLEAVETG